MRRGGRRGGAMSRPGWREVVVEKGDWEGELCLGVWWKAAVEGMVEG